MIRQLETNPERSRLPMGSRSLLFGIHQFLIHPLLLAAAWRELYGFPRDPRLWVCFFLHDIGYWGRHRLDDADGERHPELGARLAARMFDSQELKPGVLILHADGELEVCGSYREDLFPLLGSSVILGEWGQLCLLHSRFYAKRIGRNPSALCIADKWAITIEPAWLHILRGRLSGEIWEYVGERLREGSKYAEEERGPLSLARLIEQGQPAERILAYWHAGMVDVIDAWVRNQPGHRLSGTEAPPSRTAALRCKWGLG